jgi:hypothetical protein
MKKLLVWHNMYHPKDIFTEEGYETYKAHLHNIKQALNYIENHRDDLHIGALDGKQEDLWFNIYGGFFELEKVLREGDGEKDE